MPSARRAKSYRHRIALEEQLNARPNLAWRSHLWGCPASRSTDHQQDRGTLTKSNVSWADRYASAAAFNEANVCSIIGPVIAIRASYISGEAAAIAGVLLTIHQRSVSCVPASVGCIS